MEPEKSSPAFTLSLQTRVTWSTSSHIYRINFKAIFFSIFTGFFSTPTESNGRVQPDFLHALFRSGSFAVALWAFAGVLLAAAGSANQRQNVPCPLWQTGFGGHILQLRLCSTALSRDK